MASVPVMSLHRLTERVAAPFTGSRVNREAGTIAGVLICGTASANGRDYPPAVFRRDFAVYEGRPVNCDHGREATVDRRLGWFSQVAPGDDGRPRGTLNLLKSHPLYERVMEAAERNPALYGFSHVAHCETTRKNGRDVVESIKAVESIDLVAEPATTAGLFEHRTQGAAVTFTLRKFFERFGPKLGPATWGAGVKLCEDMGAAADAPVMDEPAADVADGDLKSALMAAITPMLDEAFESGDANKVCGAIKDFIKLHAKHTGKDAPAEPPADDDSGGDAEESKRRPKGLAGYIAEAEGFGLKNPTARQLTVLEGIATAAGRKAYCLEVVERASGAETPRSSGKNPGAGPLPGKTGDGKGGAPAPVPTDGKTFAESVRR